MPSWLSSPTDDVRRWADLSGPPRQVAGEITEGSVHLMHPMLRGPAQWWE